jgi:hypothetical protein
MEVKVDYRSLQDSPPMGRLSESEMDASVLSGIGADHPAAAALRPAPPVVYRASFGRKRAFIGHRDARAYDAGYCAYPAPIGDEAGTPKAMGWADHHDEAEGFAAMDEVLDWANAHAAACGVHQ